MAIPVEEGCQDTGRPGCLVTPDPRYTMSFEDIGKGFIYWCSHCGPEAHAIDKALTNAFRSRDSSFVDQFKTLIEEAENKLNKN